MAVVVKSKSGKNVTLLNPAEKGKKYAAELKAKVRCTNDHHIKRDKNGKKLGLSKGQAEAMKAGSMFGWDTPAADPKSYDISGVPVKPKHKDYER